MLDRQIDRAIDPTAVRGIGYEPTYSGVPSLFRRPFSTTPGSADIAVLGVPLDGSAVNGLDALLATVQMPGGIPVATFAIGKAGAKNAGLFAGQILAGRDARVRRKLDAYRAKQTAAVPDRP